MATAPCNLDVSVQFSDSLSSEALKFLSKEAVKNWACFAFDKGQDATATLESTSLYECVIRLVCEEESQQLNHSYRGKDKPTNVLSFNYDDLDNYLGDLVVCLPVVEREAQEQNKTVINHMTHMIVHGILHLLGYDHEDEGEAEVMEGIECIILAKLGIDNPYEPI